MTEPLTFLCLNFQFDSDCCDLHQEFADVQSNRVGSADQLRLHSIQMATTNRNPIQCAQIECWGLVSSTNVRHSTECSRYIHESIATGEYSAWNFNSISFQFHSLFTQQQYTFNGAPINEISKSIADADQTDGDRSTNNSRLSRRRNCTTRLSILSTSTSAASSEHLANLDVDLCFTALEYILTLLASQSLLALKTVNLSQREKQLIKRELCTELSVFHDFVKKRILADESRDDPLRRRKHGLVQMELCQLLSPPRTDDRSKATGSDSLRVKVTRKLHLTGQQTPSPQPSTSRKALSGLDMTHQFSPIADSTQKFSVPSTSGITGRPPLPSSTPMSSSQSPPKQAAKRGTDPAAGHDVDDDWMSGNKCFAEDDDSEPQLFFVPEEPSYCELSLVQLVEEDYFHFLSNLFTYICQSETIN